MLEKLENIYSWKTTKFEKNPPTCDLVMMPVMMILNKCQNQAGFFFKICGLLRKPEKVHYTFW